MTCYDYGNTGRISTARCSPSPPNSRTTRRQRLISRFAKLFFWPILPWNRGVYPRKSPFYILKLGKSSCSSSCLSMFIIMFMPTGWKPSERFRHFYICSLGWGGVGWGNNVHVLVHSHDVTPRHVHLHVRTYVMLRWRCVTSRRGGVGWGNNVHVLAHSHDVTPRHVHLHVRTYVMLRWRCVTSRRGGVGWGNNNVHVLAHSHDVTPRHVHLFAQMAQSATLDWHRPTSWYILPAHIAKTNLS